jgi:hypothetical protein
MPAPTLTREIPGGGPPVESGDSASGLWKVCLCGVEFISSQPASKYHNEQCKRRAQNGTARKGSLLEQVIAQKSSKVCSHCKSIEGKRWTFFWDDHDREANNLDVVLLLCAKCWSRYSGKKLGQKKQMDRQERLTDLKVADEELSESDDPLVSDCIANKLSIVHLEDIAEDKSKYKSAKRPPKIKPDDFSLRYLAKLPPSERLDYVKAYLAEVEKLTEAELDLVGTLLCEAASEDLASEAPISALGL